MAVLTGAVLIKDVARWDKSKSERVPKALHLSSLSENTCQQCKCQQCQC